MKEWLTTWQRDYLNHVTPNTAFEYGRKLELYVLPVIGNCIMSKLTNYNIQCMINGMLEKTNARGKPLSPKTIKDTYGVLHRALAQAVSVGLLRKNPAENCSLPKLKAPDLTHYETSDLRNFLNAIQGHVHENYYMMLLFTDIREAEGLGLTWDCINFEKNTIDINKQLVRNRKTGVYSFEPPKKDEYRLLTVPEDLMTILKRQRNVERAKQKRCGEVWEEHNLVFSDPTGGYLSYRTVYDCYKRIVDRIGIPKVRLHELRHAYTALALGNGDDVKTISTNLGHATSAFTMKVYAYSSTEMQKNSAGRMNNRMNDLRGLEK